MLENCDKEMTMLPLPNGKFQFNELGIITAQEYGFKEGWRECCKWFLELVKECTYTGDNDGDYIDIPELKEKIEKESEKEENDLFISTIKSMCKELNTENKNEVIDL